MDDVCSMEIHNSEFRIKRSSRVKDAFPATSGCYFTAIFILKATFLVRKTFYCYILSKMISIFADKS